MDPRRTTWRALLTERMKQQGESWAEVEAITHGDPTLDHEWAYGFGELDCPPEVVVWTAHRVYYTFQHAGFGDAASLPRHPPTSTFYVAGAARGADRIAGGARALQPRADLRPRGHDDGPSGRRSGCTPSAESGDDLAGCSSTSIPVVVVSMTTVHAHELRAYGHPAVSSSEELSGAAGDRVLADWGRGVGRRLATIVRVRRTGTLVLLVDRLRAQGD